MSESGDKIDLEKTTLNNVEQELSDSFFDEKTVSLLSALQKSKRQIVLSTESTKYSFLTYIKSFKGNKLTLHNSIPPSLIKVALEAKESYLTLPKQTFNGTKITGDGKDIYFEVKDVISHEETRGEERLSFQPDENVYLEFINPYDNKTKFKKRIFDISLSGLSFETHFDSSLLSTEEILEDIIVKIGDRNIKKCTGKIVYKKKLFDTEMRQRFQIGMSLENIEDLTNERSS